jgi:hypothetical protein
VVAVRGPERAKAERPGRRAGIGAPAWIADAARGGRRSGRTATRPGG